VKNNDIHCGKHSLQPAPNNDSGSTEQKKLFFFFLLPQDIKTPNPERSEELVVMKFGVIFVAATLDANISNCFAVSLKGEVNMLHFSTNVLKEKQVCFQLFCAYQHFKHWFYILSYTHAWSQACRHTFPMQSVSHDSHTNLTTTHTHTHTHTHSLGCNHI